jgi:hypothetical protein
MQENPVKVSVTVSTEQFRALQLTLYYVTVFNTLEELVWQFNSGREEEVYALYHLYWLHTGQQVEVRLGVPAKFR